MSKPFVSPNSTPLSSKISSIQLSKLRQGFAPQDQDDKWLITSTSTQHSTSFPAYETLQISFIRSGTGKKIVELEIEVPTDGSEGVVRKLIWDTDDGVIGGGQDEAEARERVVKVSASLFGIELEL